MYISCRFEGFWSKKWKDWYDNSSWNLKLYIILSIIVDVKEDNEEDNEGDNEEEYFTWKAHWGGRH